MYGIIIDIQSYNYKILYQYSELIGKLKQKTNHV